MSYNKPITSRIQHSTQGGMKVQEPLLDVGSVAKYKADTSLMGKDHYKKFQSTTIDATKSADTAPEPVAKQTAGQTATFGPKGTNPNPKLYACIVAEGKGVKDKKTPAKSLGPKAVGKNYKNGYYGK